MWSGYLMESLKSSFLSPIPLSLSSQHHPSNPKPRTLRIKSSSVTPDPWTLSDGNLHKPKPPSKNPKNPLSDDNARRIIKAKARYLSTLRRNQGPLAQTPTWLRRSPQQMVRYLQDDRNGHLYGKHVVAAIQAVRSLSQKPEGAYDIRTVMASFVAKLSFREMCVVLKEQKGWRQVRDFFAWMKLQLCYRPSVIAYTIVLRAYGQVGKIKLAEETFLEMLDAGCEPDEIACGTMLCTYARWGRHKSMLSFYSAVRERAIILSLAVYNFMLSSLQKKSLHQNVVQMFREMVTKGVVPNHFSYTLVICSLVKESLLEEGLATFRKMKSLGFVPEEVTYSLLITSNVKQGNADNALELYQDMQSFDIIPSNFTCSSLLSLYYKNGDYSKALSLFSEMERCKIPADEVIYGLLIRIYGKLGLYEDAEKTFEEAEQLGLLSDEKTYTTMAQVHLMAGDCTKALKYMELMRSRNISLSRFAYTVLLKCYVIKGDLGSAELTFQSLSRTGLPDAVSCNDMLNMYVKKGLLEKAKSFTLQIRKKNVVLDEELCRTVMKVYAKEGMLEEVDHLIQDLSGHVPLGNSNFIQSVSMILHSETGKIEKSKATLIAPGLPDLDALELMFSLFLANGHSVKVESTLDFLLGTSDGMSIVNRLIGKFIREGDASKAEALYGLLIKRDLKPQDGIVASMINLYGKQQKLDRVTKLFTTVSNSAFHGPEIYKSIIEAYAKYGEPGKAYHHYKECRDQGIDLSPISISVLVNNLTNHGMHQEAEDVISRSIHDNLVLDTVAYNTFLKAMLEAGKLHFAINIYDHMLSTGVSPSIQTCSTMISVYGRQRKLDKAVEMFNMAENSGLSLDEKVYTNLISLYGKSGKFQDASALFAKMQEGGIKPGKVSYNVMMNVYAAAGLYQETEELFQAMKEDGHSPDSLSYLALIKSYTKSMKYIEAEETIVGMQREGIQPLCAHFSLLMSVFAEVGQIAEAERVFETLVESGSSPDMGCYKIMLRSYMECGDREKGISLFERIQEWVKGDRYIMSCAVCMYKSGGQEERSEAILKSMNEMGISYITGLEIGSKMKAS